MNENKPTTLFITEQTTDSIQLPSILQKPQKPGKSNYYLAKTFGKNSKKMTFFEPDKTMISQISIVLPKLKVAINNHSNIELRTMQKLQEKMISEYNEIIYKKFLIIHL